MNFNASATAFWCATSIRAAMVGSATAHRVLTLFGGENVRSKPATAVAAGRECLAIVPANSRASRGCRPNSLTNTSRATAVRIRARSSTDTGASRRSPRDLFNSSIRRATSIRNSSTRPDTLYGTPSRIASSATCCGSDGSR